MGKFRTTQQNGMRQRREPPTFLTDTSWRSFSTYKQLLFKKIGTTVTRAASNRINQKK